MRRLPQPLPASREPAGRSELAEGAGSVGMHWGIGPRDDVRFNAAAWPSVMKVNQAC